mmetsp:Transcript_34165/g.98132  ORF Transcript_34165/g.98132 Transcript_34165/m.98132 type:complete len:238 (-) Transcript_34165:289-1002(-)
MAAWRRCPLKRSWERTWSARRRRGIEAGKRCPMTRSLDRTWGASRRQCRGLLGPQRRRWPLPPPRQPRPPPRRRRQGPWWRLLRRPGRLRRQQWWMRRRRRIGLWTPTWLLNVWEAIRPPPPALAPLLAPLLLAPRPLLVPLQMLLPRVVRGRLLPPMPPGTREATCRPPPKSPTPLLRSRPRPTVRRCPACRQLLPQAPPTVRRILHRPLRGATRAPPRWCRDGRRLLLPPGTILR